MNSVQTAVILKLFEAPDAVRVLEKGRFELVHLESSGLDFEAMWLASVQRFSGDSFLQDAI